MSVFFKWQSNSDSTQLLDTIRVARCCTREKCIEDISISWKATAYQEKPHLEP